MSMINRVAIAAATALSALALYDAIHAGLTGRPSAFSDAFGMTPMMIIGGVVHGLTYAALVAVLVVQRRRIDARSAARRWIRRLLVVDFGLLATMFLIGTPFLPRMERAGWGDVSSAIGGISFLLMFVLSAALGVASVRIPQLRAAALILIGTVPLIGLAIALAALGTGFGHPAYPEAAIYLGVAMLGHRFAPVRTPAAARRVPTPQIASFTSEPAPPKPWR
jgi:hypothetical protein